VSWGMDANGAMANVTISANTGVYGYQGNPNAVGVASVGSTTYDGGDALVKFALNAVGHVIPYEVENACGDKSCYYGARLHTSKNKLELAKRSGGSTSILASVPFTASANTLYYLRLDVATGTTTNLRARLLVAICAAP